MHFFTSVTSNYIPKARVLAHSVKQHHPDAKFHLLLSDTVPSWLQMPDEPFDTVITADMLGITDFSRWVYKHSVVELCTAVKGFGFQYIIRQHNADKVAYLDPDMVAFSPLTPLYEMLDQWSILLTPHQTEPETTPEGILDNEICSLKHGVFNLGFLAIRASGEGKRFVDWWAARLQDHCYDDIPGGLFTDQRWVDLAPCFFEDLHVIRDPGYNIATWNLTHRKVGGSIDGGLTVNGLPLRIYHFSGFDSGAQHDMLNKYGAGNPTLHAMRDWYIRRCEEMGQSKYGKTPCVYGSYSNGEKIEARHRVVYRSRMDVMQHFPNPYSADDVNQSYYHWYKAHFPDNQNATGLPGQLLQIELHQARGELDLIYRSRSWKLARRIAGIAKRLGMS